MLRIWIGPGKGNYASPCMWCRMFLGAMWHMCQSVCCLSSELAVVLKGCKHLHLLVLRWNKIQYNSSINWLYNALQNWLVSTINLAPIPRIESKIASSRNLHWLCFHTAMCKARINHSHSWVRPVTSVFTNFCPRRFIHVSFLATISFFPTDFVCK